MLALGRGILMNRALVKLSKVKPPAGLAQLFDDPTLVGNEKREDYNSFFAAVAAAVNPGDAIGWAPMIAHARDDLGNAMKYVGTPAASLATLSA
jgi:hypothetical protein